MSTNRLPCYGWVVVTGKGLPLWWTLAGKPKDSIRELIKSQLVDEVHGWNTYIQRGFDCVRVHINEQAAK